VEGVPCALGVVGWGVVGFGGAWSGDGGRDVRGIGAVLAGRKLLAPRRRASTSGSKWRGGAAAPVPPGSESSPLPFSQRPLPHAFLIGHSTVCLPAILHTQGLPAVGLPTVLLQSLGLDVLVLGAVVCRHGRGI